jgi:uncharacterized protein YkwD
MNWVDIMLILIVLLSIWGGVQRGFLLGALNLAAWIGSLLISFHFYHYVANFIENQITSLGVWTLPVAFIGTVILARIFLSIIVYTLLRAMPPEVHQNEMNHFLGIIPGVINGVIYATLIAALLLAFPLADGLSAATRNSQVANKLATQVEWLDEKLSPVFDKAVRQTINKLTVEPDSEKSVKLPFTSASLKVREDLEEQMLEMINEERRKQGLKILRADPELTAVAREHSKDMFVRGYFSHYTPEGKDPFYRMRAAGVKFLVAGENLALAQSLSIAHEGLMNSPGHRANILRPGFGRVGIGIFDGGMRGLMISQEFRN